MPLKNSVLTTPGQVYGRPFDGPTNFQVQGVIDITALTSAEVDSDGYIKPGVPLREISTGVFGLVNGAAQVIRAMVPESIKVANGNAAGDLSAASNAFPIGLYTRTQARRPIIEDNLGRVLSANELAAFAAAGSTITLVG